MLKFIIVWVIAILWSGSIMAQLLTPLTHDIPRVRAKNSFQPLGQHGLLDTPLQLPFFDDFAGSEGLPDPSHWRSGGGVLVSNRYALDPITIRTATFDGLRADGQPYGPSSLVGPVDTLASQPIQLSGLQPADSLYLSFYWQAGGLGDAPNFSSAGNYFLRLEFRKNSGEWATVWQENGLGRTTPFVPVMVPLREVAYFHEAFAFRFVSSGNQGGVRDLWNVDYVLLDQNRRRGQLHSHDVAMRYQVSSLLRRFTAMPVHQFFLDPAAELSPSVQTYLANLNNMPAAISWRGVLRNQTTGQPADTFLRGNAVIPAPDQQYLIQGSVSASQIAFSRQALQLRHTLFLTTKEQDTRYRYNDTVSRVTELSDYYAYDDGTAETGFSYNASGTVHVAYRFELNQPDQVAAFRMYFTRTNAPGTVLSFRIWREENGLPVEPAVYTQGFRVPEAENLDKFVEVKLTEPVPVSGVFYAGWSQPAGTSFMNVGYDLNESAVSKMFGWTISTGWTALELDGGALLLRPVMNGIITGNKGEVASPRLEVAPNPSSGKIAIEGAYEQVCIYDVSGRSLLCRTQEEVGTALDLGFLPQGMYLLRFTTRHSVQVRKLMIRR